MKLQSALLTGAGAAVSLFTLALVAIMFADVSMRFTLLSPLPWGWEVTTLLFSWLAMAALPLAVVAANDDDSSRARRASQLGVMAQVAILVLIGCVGARRTYDAIAAQEVSFGPAEFPVSWSLVAIPTGCFAAAVVLLLRLFARQAADD